MCKTQLLNSYITFLSSEFIVTVLVAFVDKLFVTFALLVMLEILSHTITESLVFYIAMIPTIIFLSLMIPFTLTLTFVIIPYLIFDLRTSDN